MLDTAGMTAMTFAIGGMASGCPPTSPKSASSRPLTANSTFGGILVVAGLLATLAGGMAGDSSLRDSRASYFLVSAAGSARGVSAVARDAVRAVPVRVGVDFPRGFFCLFFNTGPSNTILANVTPPAIRATRVRGQHPRHPPALGDVASPPIIGWIRDRSNLTVGFIVVSVMMLVGGLIWLVGRSISNATPMPRRE